MKTYDIEAVKLGLLISGETEAESPTMGDGENPVLLPKPPPPNPGLFIPFFEASILCL